MANLRIPTLADVYNAKLVVGRHLKPTPLVFSRKLSSMLGCEIYVKLENLQPIGSFKLRGGLNYFHSMGEIAKKRGVITASTGNHAQSIAYAGALYDSRVIVVMPEGVSKVKIDAIKELGGEVQTWGTLFEEAAARAQQLAKNEGYLFVHPINEPLLYEGVATMHLEIFEELPSLDLVINPIGGGSGASGACIVYKNLKPSVAVVGAQAEGAPAFYQSWKKGSVVSTDSVNTIAEGLATSTAYELPLTIMRGKIDDIALVSDEEIKEAIRLLLVTIGQVAEPSGAASTAAALKIRDRLRGKKVVLMLTGRNIQPELLNEIIKSKNS
jgi:threonine dehydratase